MASTKDIAKLFKEMALAAEFLGENRFRVLAYQKVADILFEIDKDIKSVEELKEYLTTNQIHGIGESSLEKIEEYLKTGRIKKHDEFLQKVPKELLEIMDAPGIGPKTLKTLYDVFGIKNKEELLKALDDPRIKTIKGFGPKKIENIKRGIKLFEQSKERMFITEAYSLAQDILNYMKGCKEIINISVAGSLRRMKETIGDIDILVSAKKEDFQKVHEYFKGYKDIEQVIGSGETKTSILLKNSKQVDLRVLKPEEWGSGLQYFTGSKEHNVKIRDIAKEKGYKISEYGIFEIASGKRLGGEKEEDIYNVLGMVMPPPEIREDKGEIELAMQGIIPELVGYDDIKGDFHMHTTYSDGKASLRQMVQTCYELGYKYIVISDHTKSLRVAGGLDEEGFRNQWKEIEQVQKEYKDMTILRGCEVDILEDGSLDLPDSFLEEFDYVIASIHSHMSPNTDNTKRVLKACHNKYVNQIGHPTGKNYGYRDGYILNMEEVIKAALDTNTALELNIPRADLSPDNIRLAVERGVTISIVTDSHSSSHLQFMKVGVGLARRGWALKERVLNTKPLEEVRAFVRRKR
ncbi:MAG: DNA polymerase/3'-5' exonuclease PolX [Hydrogenobaculum sp.]